MTATPSLELEIERAVPGGRMLARHEGRVVFVAGAVPGERVRATVTRRSGQVWWADTVEVLEASADRRAPTSDPRCGGALYGHINYARQRELKADVIRDAFRRIAKHPLDAAVPVAASPEFGYRLRTRLHAQGTQLGFLLEGTHVLCDAEVTRQLTPDSYAAVGCLRDALGDRTHACASVTLSESISGGDRVALLELRPTADPARFSGLASIDGLTGVAVLAPGGMFTCVGADRIVEDARTLLGQEGPVQWVRQSASFFQGNRFLVGELVRRVMALAEGDRFVDLYSGIGLFAVALANRGAHGLAVEGDSASGQDLSGNAEQCDGRLEVRLGPVEESVATRPGPRPDVVVVDPPRTGLSSEVMAGLLQWRAPRLVYVSCDVATLARDAGRLLAGGYRLSGLEALDMFPNTPHIECVATFNVE